VYGWTDSPQILTGEHLVVLSPHLRLHGKSGDNGLRFNFVEQGPYPRDQIEPFGAGARDVIGRFEGTIIRIPLRTEEQAKTSEIIALAVTPDDILNEFKAFQSEVADSLLYLKNIEKIEFKLDGRSLGFAEIINIADIRTSRLQIKNAITNATTGSFAFQLKISHSYKHGAQEITSMRTFHLQHRFADIPANTSSRDLADWAARESFFPWIALAAPLIPWSASEAQSRIFVTLPLPIFMKDNLVNIHGMFALSRDRRSLWTPMDAQSAGKETKEIQWNTYLYKNVIPAAWQEMLVALAKLGQPIYKYLPIITPRPSALDETLAADVLRLVISENSPIWYSTTNEMLPLTDGYLPLEQIPAPLLKALQPFSMPIFHKIPDRIVTLIRQGGYTYRPLSAGNVRHWLRQQFSAGFGTDKSSAIELLRYILVDRNYADLHSLPLFLCRDDKLRALSSHSHLSIKTFEDGFYVATEEEFQLFGGNGSQFLDESVCKLPQIKNDLNAIRKAVNLGVFTLSSFRLYARKRGLEAQGNEFEIESAADFGWIQRLWKWLDKHSASDVRTAVEGLYLIPLQSSSKLHLVHSWIHKTLLIPHATGGALIMKIYEKARKSFPLVDGRLNVSAKGFLRSTRRIIDTTDIRTIFEWITPEIVAALSDSTRDDLRKYLVAHTTFDLSEIDRVHLSRLPIYKTLLVQRNMSSK
jgi:sacsin